LKQLLIILVLVFIGSQVWSQTDTQTIKGLDTGSTATRVELPKPVKISRAPIVVKRKTIIDTLKRVDTGTTLKAQRSLPAPSDSGVTRTPVKNDGIQTKHPVAKKPFDRFYGKMLDNPFFKSREKPVFLVIDERDKSSKDDMFYLVLGLLLFLAFIKLVFSRYFQNVFRLFFQPTFRQKQTREQLQQGNLPSLLLNLFFIFSTAAYISFLFTYYNITDVGFWMLFLYSSLSLLVLYTGKYILLSFAGWVFNVKEAAEVYIFSIYLINKILGVVLIPFTIIIAFSFPNIINVSITISALVIGLLFVYRYRVSYPAVRKEVKVSPLHFFFYVFAFEIIPLLLIYKTLMLYLNKSL
jgi:hypothetical protein